MNRITTQGVGTGKGLGLDYIYILTYMCVFVCFVLASLYLFCFVLFCLLVCNFAPGDTREELSVR